MTTEAMRQFGLAVRTRRLAEEMSMTELAERALGNPDRKGYVGQVEAGKRNLSPETIDKFVQALNLPIEVANAALIGPPPEPPDAHEEKIDRDAERLIRSVRKDPNAPNAAEALLIALAYDFAGGSHRDVHDAYVALRTALQAADDMRKRGLLVGNTGGQVEAVLAEVARLNDAGSREEAADFLDQEMARLDQQRDTLFQQQLAQDRIRNRPDLAAARLIKDLRREAQPGGLFQAVYRLCRDWQDRGDNTGDLFALHVALELAKANQRRANGGNEAWALSTLGGCHRSLAERSIKPGHLKVARNACEAAVRKTSKQKDPLNWAARNSSLGLVLQEIGERDADPKLLQAALAAQQDALDIQRVHGGPDNWKEIQNNLGIAWLSLGEVTRDPSSLKEAVAHLSEALSLVDRDANAISWSITQSNLALARRWLGAITKGLDQLTQARACYADCQEIRKRDKVPFLWAQTQWNIADLELARFALEPDPTLLTEARSRVLEAREVFVDGSDYQTQRCDDLLAQIDAAEAAQ
ncbi:helix-turn-helix domain-containing protein [Shimia ponticola]|uniref:helix-turn-helix domain-containing protein n=1 Tax=Shimia ponticola TaxID=2582893 RepID=UPI0011BD4571|nr:helix-turn-helix transcriptional regulator [Shimia ponticola]